MPVPNSRRSGGPRTGVGRAVVRHNAIKTGAYSAQVVLPGEDPAEFESLKAQLVQDFEPVGMAEAAMVHDLAVLTWKKLRVNRVEHAVLLQMMQLPLLLDAVEKALGSELLPAARDRVVPVFVPVTQAEWEASARLLEQVQALRAAPGRLRRSGSVRKRWPELYEVLLSTAEDNGVDADAVMDGIVEADASELGKLLDEVIRECDAITWLWDRNEALRLAVQRARDSRILVYLKSDNTQRAYDEIGRAFYRTLAELRRQQDWRVRRSAIAVDDVTPKMSGS